MPYITQDSRNLVDPHIDALIAEIRKHQTDDVDGVTNYVVSRIVCGSLRPNSGWNYSFLNRAYGTFLSAGAEFLRRLVVPYEQKKSNSYAGGLDLPCYQELSDGQTMFTINNTRQFPHYSDGIVVPPHDGYARSIYGDKAE